MAKRPIRPAILSLDERAAIERCREHVLGHAAVTWKLLFPPETLVLLGRSQEVTQAQSASLQVELRDYSCALFDCEAVEYKQRAHDEATLGSWLMIVAECVQAETIEETRGRFENIRCTIVERRRVVRDALAKRIDHWIAAYRVWKSKPLVSRAPPPPSELGGRGMGFSLPRQKALDTAESPRTPSNAPGARLKEYREEAGLTQEVLAELIGVSARSVKRHEANETAIRPTNRRAYERELSRSLDRKITL